MESDCSTCVIQSKRSEGFYVCHSERSVESDCSTYVIQSKRSAAKKLIASRRGELFLQSNQIHSPKLVFVESGGLEGVRFLANALNDINAASSRMT